MPAQPFRPVPLIAGPHSAAVRTFLDRAATAAAAESDGSRLSLATLARLAADLAHELDTTQPHCIDDRRHLAFDRLLCRPCAPLLPRNRDDVAPLSRRLIPGLMKALAMMAGEDVMAERRLVAANLLTAARARGDGIVDWDDLARDPLVVRMVRATLMAAAHHFAAFDRRLDWLCLVVDNSRTPAYAEDKDVDWRCTPERAILLLDALFTDLALYLAQPGGEARLMAEFGTGPTTALQALIGTLATRRPAALATVAA